MNSCVKRVKNYKRSTTLHSRLSNLTVISMNSDLIISTDYDTIINYFAHKIEELNLRNHCLQAHKQKFTQCQLELTDYVPEHSLFFCSF